MMKKILLSLFILCHLSLSAQKKPIREYFQQEVNYTINVKLDDIQHKLRGFESIEYINNSPHTLTFLYFHLWPNAYRSNKTALAKQLLENGESQMHFANPERDYGYIDSLLFVVDNDTIKWEYDSLNMDIAKLYLNKPLQPNQKIIITTPFLVKIPSSFSRLGHVGQSYQITQWYPKPAVYDRNGWNQMPYLDQGEFYSEFGSFDVSITVPENYVIAATGDLFECPQEEKWLETRAKYTAGLLEDHKVNKAGIIRGEYSDDFPASSKYWKTIRYKQKNVHDFAWFADKRFYVLRGEYNFKKSGRNVTLWSFFTKSNSKYWAKSTEYLSDAIKYYSEWNGEYPYNVVSAVDGTISAGGGMEYPTITVIGDMGSDIGLETVIMHEVGHNWFYGILGSNERLHPWMDEGLNSFNEMRYIETKYPTLEMLSTFSDQLSGINETFGMKGLKQRYQYYLAYIINARRNYDQPIEGKAEEFTSMNYGGIVYSKTAIAFDYLRAYLGDKVFDKCMHTYFDRWKFKHPEPQDLKDVFQEIAQKDLSWFFDDYIKTNDVIDYKLKRKKRVDRSSSNTYMWMKYEESLVIKNEGTISAPFCIQGIKADTVANVVWYAGHKGTQTVFFPNGPYDYFIIDFKERIPDVDRKNHMMKEKGTFKRVEKLKFQFLGSIETPKKSVVYFTPVLGGNMYDGFMAGMLFYNNLFPQRNFEWKIMPMFGFRSKLPVGAAQFDWHINTRHSNILNNIDAGFGISSFQTNYIEGAPFTLKDGFVKASPYVTFTLKKKTARSVNNHKIGLRSSVISENQYTDCDGNCGIVAIDQFTNAIVYYNELNYWYKNTTTLKPWSLHFQTQQSEDFLKSSAEWNYKLIYNRKKKFIDLRVFAGKFWMNNTTSSRYNFRMDGQHGFHDYTYDQIFPGRMEADGLWSKQFIANHGGFKVPTANGQSIDWLSAVNVKASLPFPILHVFADAGFSGYNGQSVFLYDAGFYIPLAQGVIEIYVPLLYSKKIQDEFAAKGWGMGEAIRFTLNLKAVNPFTLLKNIKP